MRVRVRGEQGERRIERVWDMVISDVNGPKTPVQATALLLEQLLAGRIQPGARPAVAVFSRAEAETQLATIAAKFEHRERVITPIFPQVLGASIAALPAPVQSLHDVGFIKRYRGIAQVRTATSWYGRVAAFVGGFPTRGNHSVRAEVEVMADDNFEVWTRRIGDHSFKSVLRYEQFADDTQGMTEQFGFMRFRLGLRVRDGDLQFPIESGRIFGLLSMPRFLLPVSDSSERIDALGRFQFDVRLSMPGGALIAHYKGYLELVS